MYWHYSPLRRELGHIYNVTIEGGGSQFGSGIYSLGYTYINSYTIYGNAASSSGGGIFNKVQMWLLNSTVYQNTTAGSGVCIAIGCAENSGPDSSYISATIINITISGNSAVSGGGIYAYTGLEYNLINTTINNIYQMTLGAFALSPTSSRFWSEQAKISLFAPNRLLRQEGSSSHNMRTP